MNTSNQPTWLHFTTLSSSVGSQDNNEVQKVNSGYVMWSVCSNVNKDSDPKAKDLSHKAKDLSHKAKDLGPKAKDSRYQGQIFHRSSPFSVRHFFHC